MDKFGALAKLKEIIVTQSKEQVPSAEVLSERLLAAARKASSNSAFRRPVANEDAGSQFVPVELSTIVRHVRFAEKLGLVTYRLADIPYLPGLEPVPSDYSEEVVDSRIVKFLADRGVSMNRLAAAINSIDFKDINSIVEALFSSNGRSLGDGDLKRCVRLLGDCGVSLRFSRKKTYAMKRGRRK